MNQTGGKVDKNVWVCKYKIIRLNLVQRLNITDIIDEDNNIYFNLFTIYNLQSRIIKSGGGVTNAYWSFRVGALMRALIVKTTFLPIVGNAYVHPVPHPLGLLFK